MSELIEELEERWPTDGITISCRECDTVIYSTSDYAIQTPTYVHKLVRSVIINHIKKTGHTDYDTSILEYQVLKEIGCTITVNED